MTHARILFLAVALAALAACEPETAGISGDTSPPVATVHGVPVSRQLYDAYVKAITGGKTPAELTPEQRRAALDSLIRARRVVEEAEKEGLDKSGDAPYLLEVSRLNTLEQVAEERYLKDKEPTEADLRAEYNGSLAFNNTEYHAREILVATEPLAEKVIQRLDKGEKFDVLAKEVSIDSSKNNSGDVGWFTLSHIMPEFHTPVMALRPGEYTHEPVQTQYGWHVIQLLAARRVTPPAFAQVRQRLEQAVREKKFGVYTEILMHNVKIVRSLEQPANALVAAAPPAPTAARGCLAGTDCSNTADSPNPDELRPVSEVEGLLAPCLAGTDCRFHVPKPRDVPPLSESAEPQLPPTSEEAEFSTADASLEKFTSKSPAKRPAAPGTTSARTATTAPHKN